jgi:hypothetical protein
MEENNILSCDVGVVTDIMTARVIGIIKDIMLFGREQYSVT